MPTPTRWMILDKYPFELLPGEPTQVTVGDKSYYQYLNERPNETGKNVQAVIWLLRNFPKGLRIMEPFGGCGVFSIALQNELKPSSHHIVELDGGCVAQLKYCLRNYPSRILILHGDAHDYLGHGPADIFVCDFPVFTMTRLLRGEWATEMSRMATQKPKAILITDGSSYLYHFVHKTLLKYCPEITSDRESYAHAMGRLLYWLYGYSVTGCGYHGTCFYLRAEPVPPGEIEFKRFPAGSGPAGLRKVQ